MTMYHVEQRPGLFRCERLDFVALYFWAIDQPRHIALDAPPFDGLLQGNAQNCFGITYGFVAKLAGLPALLEQRTDHRLHMLRRELRKLMSAEVRNQVVPDRLFVAAIRGRAYLRVYRLQPGAQKLRNRLPLGRDVEAFLTL